MGLFETNKAFKNHLKQDNPGNAGGAPCLTHYCVFLAEEKKNPQTPKSFGSFLRSV